MINLDGYANADVGTQSETSGQTQLVAHSLWTSSTDMDMVVFTFSPSWTSSAQVFADLQDGWHSSHPAVAYSRDTNRWIVAFERQNTFSQIRLYLHTRDNTGFNTGQMVFMSRMTSTSHDWKPDVGVHVGGRLALIVCQSEFGSQFTTNGTSEVFGRLIDVSTGAAASDPMPLAGAVSSTIDREGPTVSVQSHGSFYWRTAWSQRTTSTKFAIHSAQVDTDGTLRAAQRIDNPAQDFDKVLARIDGRDGEFLVTYTLADSPGREFGRFLQATRFQNANPVANLRHRTLVTASSVETVANSGIAYDSNTASHWVVSWHSGSTGGTPQRAWLARVGYEAGITELQAVTDLGQLGSRPVVAFASTPPRFVVVNSQFNNVVARDLIYPTAAIVTVGLGCGSTTNTARNPYSGNHNFTLTLGNAPPGQTAICFLALGQAAVPLDFMGMSGCTLHLSPSSLVSLPPTPVTLLRLAVQHAPLPESFVGELFAQWWYSDPSAAGGARMSPALVAHVR